MSLLLEGQAPVIPGVRHLAMLARSLPLVALGFFAADEPQAAKYDLHSYRSVPAVVSGMVPYASTQLVLVEEQQDARRTDHNKALLYGRSAPAASVPGAPWYLWNRKQLQLEAEGDFPRVDQQKLNNYRWPTVEPTTGTQSWFVWQSPPIRWDEDDAKRFDHTLLHRYRSTAQVVPQTWLARVKPQYRIDEEPYDTEKPLSLVAFRQSVVSPATQPQRLWLWKQSRVDADDDSTRRANNDALHNYRYSFQTVGQSWQYWIKPQKRVDEEQYSVPGPANLAPYRQITPVVEPGQPWYLWPSAKADQTVEPNPVVTDHAKALYPFRPHDAIEPPPAPTFVDAGKRRHPVLIDYRGRIYEFETEQKARDFLSEMAPRDIARIEKKAKRIAKTLQATGSAFVVPDVTAARIVSGSQSLADSLELSALSQREFLRNMVQRRLDYEQAMREKVAEDMRIERQRMQDDDDAAAVAAVIMMMESA